MLETTNNGYQRSAWYWGAGFLIVGYFCMGRSFAYWGIPPLHLFIGEIALGCFLFWGPVSARGRWPWVVANSLSLRRYKQLLLAFLAFGLFQVFRGILLGHPALSSVRDLAFNYYPIYFFLGVWVASNDPDFLPKLLRVAAFANGFYGILYILVLSRLAWFFPGVSQDISPVPVFGQPLFSGVILLGLLSVEEDLARVWPLLLLNAAVLIGMVTRGEWLGFAAGLFIWAWLTKNMRRVVLGAAVVLVILAAMYVTNFSIDAPEGRGGTISAGALVGRVIAPVDSDLASDFTAEASVHEATAAFRTLWWIAIWESVHESVSRTLFGHGYGYPLGDLVPYLEGDFIRTPHNVFFYALGYTGWVGVLIFALLQVEIARLSWAVYRKTDQPYAFVSWMAMLIYSLFTAFFETPYGAIPFYLLMGCACSPVLYPKGCMSSPASRLVSRANTLNPLPGTAG